MSDKYPFIPDYLTKALEDTSIPLIDLMHGYLKQEMLVVEEEMKNNTDRFFQGYIEALTNCYVMTYNLSIDRKHIEETQ